MPGDKLIIFDTLKNSLYIRRAGILPAILCLICISSSYAGKLRKGDPETWKKKYEYLSERLFEKTDSCAIASLGLLKEATDAGDKTWISRAQSLVGKCYYIANNPEAAEEYLLKSLAVQETLNDQEVIGKSNYYLAMIRYDAKKQEESIPYFKTCLKALALTEHKWEMANAKYIYGYVLYARKDTDAARDMLQEAIDLFETYVDTKMLADCYYYYADNEYFYALKYQAAFDAYLKAAEKYTNVDKLEDAAYANLLAGEIADYYLNNSQDAITYYNKAWEYYKGTDIKKNKALLAKALASLYAAGGDNDYAATLYKEGATFYAELGNTEKQADCIQKAANIIYFAGNYPEALQLYRQSLTLYEKLNSLDGQAGAYIGLGNFYESRKEFNKAQEMFTKSLELYNKMEKPFYSGMSSGYIGLGNTWNSLGNFEKALENYKMSVECEDKGPDAERDKSVALINIANIYMSKEDDKNTEKYLKLAVEEAERTKNIHRQGSTLKLRGFYYNKKKAFQQGYDDCAEALKMVGKLKLLPEEEECYRCLYNASKGLGKFEEAMGYYQDYIASRDSINNEKRNTEINKRELQYEYEKRENQLKMEEERKQYALEEEIKRKQLFFEFEAKQSRLKAATEKKEIAMREELRRKHLAMVFQRQEDSVQLQNAKRELGLKKSIQEKEVERKQEALRTAEQRKLTYWALGGLGLFAVLLVFILKGYRDKQKANKIILKQKEETEQQKEIIEMRGLQLEEKNREIIDSINYARRLQEAILPPHKLVKQHLEESFILYKPRDIVAGDFYWMETVDLSVEMNSRLEGSSSRGQQLQKTNAVLFAVADCTGHGVPGAMVSVVCSGALNRSLKEFHLTEPGLILDKVRELVLETFEKSESQVKDGMDISLCLLDLDKREIKWSGANNPLWIVRKRTNNEAPAITRIEEIPVLELMEIKADKQPIGATEKPKPFTTHTVQLNEGDILYMTTDGYPDQFGGHKGKKFKDSNMKKLLLEICQQSMPKQMQLMDKSIESWKGQLEQVDDICVVGIKI
jgi:serine phosphatase RsbU (regulator of sigma subunit)